jgi:hypothetical protein
MFLKHYHTKHYAGKQNLLNTKGGESMSVNMYGRNLTEKEASERWGMSVHWYRRKRWSGGGPVYIKTDGKNGSVLYPEEELEKFFASKLRKSTSDQGPTA